MSGNSETEKRLKNIQILNQGTVDYETALKKQLHLHSLVVEGKADGFIVFCEHPAVITRGKRGGRDLLKLPETELARRGIKVVQTDRGGLATLHAPGQQVVYPILPIKPRNPTAFVHTIESIVIDWLRLHNIEAGRDSEYPGVWAQGKKVAAIGLRIHSGVSYHGAAINITTDLKLYDLLVSCGITDRTITSVFELTGERPDGARAVSEMTELFKETLSIEAAPL